MGAPDNHDAYDYTERLRERLRRRLQELREAAGFTKYGLSRESFVSREYLGKIVRGRANPTLPVTAQISFGLGMTLEDEEWLRLAIVATGSAKAEAALWGSPEDGTTRAVHD